MNIIYFSLLIINLVKNSLFKNVVESGLCWGPLKGAGPDAD